MLSVKLLVMRLRQCEANCPCPFSTNSEKAIIFLSEGGDRGSLWYWYQLIRHQVPPKLKVLVPPILGEGAFMNMTNSERRSTSVPRETNGQDQTTPEHVTVASVSLSAL